MPVSRFLTELGSSRPCNVRSSSAYCVPGPPVSQPTEAWAPSRSRPVRVRHQLMITAFRPCRPPGPSASGVPVSLGAGRTLGSKAVPVKSEPAPSGSPPVTCAGRISLTARSPAGHPEKLSGPPWTPCSEVCNRRVVGKIPGRTADFRRARHAARPVHRGRGQDQPRSTVTPPTARLPRRTTRNRPCRRSDGAGRASGSVTLRLFR
jgi:hypothetical protein